MTYCLIYMRSGNDKNSSQLLAFVFCCIIVLHNKIGFIFSGTSCFTLQLQIESSCAVLVNNATPVSLNCSPEWQLHLCDSYYKKKGNSDEKDDLYDMKRTVLTRFPLETTSTSGIVSNNQSVTFLLHIKL